MRIWAGFWLVALIWGSSFMLISIGVEFVHPLHLVFIRTGIAAIGMGLIIVLFRRPIPRDPKTILSLIAIGIINNLLPFLLITWGETHIDSGLASVLQATAALFTMVMAHFLFDDERMTVRKTIGLLCGFVGVVVLAARSASGESSNEFAGQIAIVLASLCYAIGGTFSRVVIKGKVEPVVVAAIAMLSASLSAAILMGIGTAANLMPAHTPVDLKPDALIAVLVLGVVNTFVAYLIFYEIVRVLGAARSSTVTYIVPAVGLFLGVLFLGEKLDAYIIVGAGLIFMGIGLVNLRFGRWGRKAKPDAIEPKAAASAAGD